MKKEESQSAGRYISIIHRAAQCFFAKKFKKYRIGTGQIPILMALFRADGITQDAAAQYFNADKSTIATTIKKLISEGYVIKQQDHQDKRAVRLYLTNRGKALKPCISQALKQWTDVLTHDFTPAEKSKMFNFLDRMAENAINETNNEKHKE